MLSRLTLSIESEVINQCEELSVHILFHLNYLINLGPWAKLYFRSYILIFFFNKT